MKLVMTLLCRDAADILEAQLAFHLNAGVDFVIATDHRSEDGTTEILERHEREGHLHLIREESEQFEQTRWVTRMARLAATDFGASWVLNSDSDEFWWPRGADLKDVLAAIPDRYGLIRGHWRTFPPRPDDGRFFAERMTVRLAPVAPINDPTTPWRPNAKVIHRAHPQVVVRKGNHSVDGVPLQPLRGWSPSRFCTSRGALRRMRRKRRPTSPRRRCTTSWGSLMRLRLRVIWASATTPSSSMTTRSSAGSLTARSSRTPGCAMPSVRSRAPAKSRRTCPGDASASTSGTSALTFARPTVVDDVSYAVDVAVYAEAELVRARRQLDDLEQRVALLEHRLGHRLVRACGGRCVEATSCDGQQLAACRDRLPVSESRWSSTGPTSVAPSRTR